MLIQEQKEYCMRVCQDSLSQYRLQVMVSWIASSVVMICGVTTTRQSQNGSPGRGDMKSPLKKKCKMQPTVGEVVEGTGKE